ncbi:kelch-like protein 7 [Arctopsyche grandis]|uniref:kelch-like protein 7 n=1 Tax=Arctopsyche grandis TaxID=121162 RepID=UPI00406D65D1
MFVVKAKSDFAAKRIKYLYADTKQKKYYDSIFTAQNRSFHVHLIVLSACSEFFGQYEDTVSEIFSGFKVKVIDALLKYCYTGEINDHDFEKLMELANLLKVKIPPQFKTVDLSNCLEVLKLTEDFELNKQAFALILENFETLYKTQYFLNLLANTVFVILDLDNLIVPSEETVFNSVKLWINYDEASRKNDLVKLMSTVRLSLLSSEFIVREVMMFCTSSEECMVSLRQAILDKISRLR